MITRNLEPVKNIRNAVAGIMNRKDNIDLCKYFDIVAHNMWYDEKECNNKFHSDKFTIMGNHFKVPKYHSTYDFEDVKNFIEYYKNDKENYEYLTDGLVITFNHPELCNDLENKTNHHYKWNCAYKLESESKATIIKSIDWQAGRTGKITPFRQVPKVLAVHFLVPVTKIKHVGCWRIGSERDLQKKEEMVAQG